MAFQSSPMIRIFGNGSDQGASTQVGEVEIDVATGTATLRAVTGLPAPVLTFGASPLREALESAMANIDGFPSRGFRLDVDDDPSAAADQSEIEYVEPVAPASAYCKLKSPGPALVWDQVDPETLRGLLMALMDMGA